MASSSVTTGPSCRDVPAPAWLLPSHSSLMAGGERATGHGCREGAPEVPQEVVEEEEEELLVSSLANPEVVPLTAEVGDGLPVTTLMVSNICRRVMQEEAMQYWPSNLYKYDFFYSHFDLSRHRASGRVFINFATPQHAAAFRILWNGMIDDVLSGKDDKGVRKPILVEVARRQGFQRNVAYWQLRLRRDVPAAFCPAIFVGGDRAVFWEYMGVPRFQ